MFAKLLKHDSRAVLKYWWIAAVSSVLIALIGGACIRVVSIEHTNYEIIQVVAVLGIIFSVIALAVFPVLSEILVLIRFYKNFFTDEGYLTFTLPVKKTSLIDSKLAMALIFSFVSFIVLLCDIFIMLAIGIPNEFFDPEIWGPLGEAISELFQYLGGYGIIYAVLILLMLPVGAVSQYLIIFICMTLAATIAKKHKVLAAIGIYYGYSFAVSSVMQILSFVGAFNFFIKLAEIPEGSLYATIAFILLGLLGISLIFTAAFYMFEHYLLDKRLNLD